MLGGGTFVTQNKVLPGTYHNFVNKSYVTSSVLGERGVVAMPIALSWGDPGEVITVTAEEFAKDSVKIFGYDYDAPELLEVREVFKHAQKVYFYNLADTGSAAATCTYATAKKHGVRGNDLKVVIQKNLDNNDLFDVTLYLGTTVVHEQTVAKIGDLKESKFVTWGTTALAVTAGEALTGGKTGTVATTSYQGALDTFESYQFNTLVCPDASVSEVYAAYTKRMRDEMGVKFQTILPNVIDADHEGLVQMIPEQPVTAWVAGALAGCAVNKSCTNMTYDGEKTIPVKYTQVELENYIKTGVFVFHQVYDEIHTLLDINSLLTYTTDKGSDFASNQVVRVIDQCGNDTAKIFNQKYLGKIQNDDNGRISLWNDIVTHRRELQTLRAIDKYESARLTIAKGNDKFSVVITEEISIIGAMEKLYITTVI